MNRDVTTEKTDKTVVSPKFLDALTLSQSGGKLVDYTCHRGFVSPKKIMRLRPWKQTWSFLFSEWNDEVCTALQKKIKSKLMSKVYFQRLNNFVCNIIFFIFCLYQIYVLLVLVINYVFLSSHLLIFIIWGLLVQKMFT